MVSEATTREDQAYLFGHPTGLYTLFFAEMWERFSYYGMRALLVFYMIKGFLGYGDEDAYSVYGAYTALVYMTPFIGGLIADRLMGARRAVVLGGLLMAGGHLLMTIESSLSFYTALALLITGNGFFKPNISAMVGELYEAGSPKRDAGFTIFYMGINLGAAMSPLLCGYVGETYGWHYGFGLATIGMLLGLAIFAMPTRLAQGLIGLAALLTGAGLMWFTPDSAIATTINIVIAFVLVLGGVVAMTALNRGGLPDDVGAPPDATRSAGSDWPIYGGVLVAIPVLTLFVSNFSFFNCVPVEPSPDASYAAEAPACEEKPVVFFGDETINSVTSSLGSMGPIAAVFLKEVSRPAGLLLSIIGILALAYLLIEIFQLEMIWRHRMIVALVLIFFQMLFFAFFEQAGSSMNNFADRNVDRVLEDRVVTMADVGQILEIQPTQEQVGYMYEGESFSITHLNDLRSAHEGPDFTVSWPITEEHVGMGIAARKAELPASLFQSVNPGFILLFGLAFAAMWTWLRQHNRDPSSPAKFALGLLQLGLGFVALWYGAETATDRGMVHMNWLILGYLLHTSGELCLSPVGLSTMTKLSPKILVSTLMGSWFLATAFSQYLAAIISQFTGVTHESGSSLVIPPPSQTVDVYGGVFFQIGMAAVICAVACFVLSPFLTAWMHEDQMGQEN